MAEIFNWQQAVHDPRFWAVRYGQFPGVTENERCAYINEYDFFQLAIYEDDPLAGYVGEGDDPQLAEIEAGFRRLALPLPEGYIWLMDFAAEEGEDMMGIYHAIFHSDMDPAGFLHPTSTGLSLAEESGHERLPGLRWAELKQIVICLAQNWSGDFDVQAIIPLLYPVVGVITFEELEDIHQTLTTAWQGLQVLDAPQIAVWLAETITVYSQGWIWNFEKEWVPQYHVQDYEGDLWVKIEENGWQTFFSSSERSFKKDSSHFLQFFSMLKRHSCNALMASSPLVRSVLFAQHRHRAQNAPRAAGLPARRAQQPPGYPGGI